MNRQQFIDSENHDLVKGALIPHFDTKILDELGLWGLPHTDVEFRRNRLYFSVRKIITPRIYDTKTQQWVVDYSRPQRCEVIQG